MIFVLVVWRCLAVIGMEDFSSQRRRPGSTLNFYWRENNQKTFCYLCRSARSPFWARHRVVEAELGHCRVSSRRISA